MIFTEQKTETGFTYQVEEAFGTITIQSKRKLDATVLDQITVAVLKTKAPEGTITEDITFTFDQSSLWLPEDEETTS